MLNRSLLRSGSDGKAYKDRLVEFLIRKRFCYQIAKLPIYPDHKFCIQDGFRGLIPFCLFLHGQFYNGAPYDYLDLEQATK